MFSVEIVMPWLLKERRCSSDAKCLTVEYANSTPEPILIGRQVCGITGRRHACGTGGFHSATVIACKKLELVTPVGAVPVGVGPEWVPVWATRTCQPVMFPSYSRAQQTRIEPIIDNNLHPDPVWRRRLL